MPLPTDQESVDNIIRMLRTKHRYLCTPVFPRDEEIIEKQADILYKKVTEYLTENIFNVYDRLDKEFSTDIDIPVEKDTEVQLTAKKFEEKYKGILGLKFCLVKYVTGWFTRPVYRVTVMVDLQDEKEK